MTRQAKAALVSVLLHGTIMAVVLAMPRLPPARQSVLMLDFQIVAAGPEAAPLLPPALPARVPPKEPRPEQAARPEPGKPARSLSSEQAEKEPERIVPSSPVPAEQPGSRESRFPAVDSVVQSSPHAGGLNVAQGKGAVAASSSPADSAPLREVAFGETFGPAFIKRIPPEYPRQEKRLGRQGKVVLRLHISELGELLAVEIVEPCSTLFNEATLKAIRASSFRPAMLNGKAVACMAILPVRFELKN